MTVRFIRKKMKCWNWLIVLVATYDSAWSQQWRLEDMTAAFDPKGVEIQWAIPQIQPAKLLKVFRVVPRQFEPGTISHLITLAGLTKDDRELSEGNSDDKAIRFSSKDHKRSLQIVPGQGWVSLRIGRPETMGQEGDLVPNDEEVLKRGTNLLATLFGISDNNLAHKHDGGLLVLRWLDHRESYNRELKKRVKCVLLRGIHFDRAIDGCPVLGLGGADMEFGNNGKLIKLELTWRNLESVREVPRPSIDYLKEMATNGAARISVGEGQPSKGLVLQTLDYCYTEQAGSNPQNVFYPTARIKGTAFDGQTNSLVYLFCPVPQIK